MSSIVRSHHNQNKLRLFHKDMVRSDLWYQKTANIEWEIIWDNGILTDPASGLEFLHFHFIESKHKKNFQIAPHGGKGVFTISSKGIAPSF